MDIELLNYWNLCLCTSTLKINQWNVHCFTPVQIIRVSLVVFQCGTVSSTFYQWCSSVPCKYSIHWCHLVVSQCTLSQPGHSSGISVHTGPTSVHRLRVRVIWHKPNIVPPSQRDAQMTILVGGVAILSDSSLSVLGQSNVWVMVKFFYICQNCSSSGGCIIAAFLPV